MEELLESKDQVTEIAMGSAWAASVWWSFKKSQKKRDWVADRSVVAPGQG